MIRDGRCVCGWIGLGESGRYLGSDFGLELL